MFHRKSSALVVAVAGFVCAVMMPGANAQDLTGRPVTLIVPFSPGGGTDIIARTVAPRLGERLRTSVVVENRPGAAGSIAAQFTARSAPDGHTLMIGSTSEIGINPSLYADLPYDVDRDFIPVTPLASTPMVLVVDPSSPIKTAADLVQLAREQPGALTFASAGVGSGAHLAAELFLHETKTKMTHVPYKGVGQAFADVIGAQKGMVLFTSLPSATALAASGKLRVVAVSTRERTSLMPDVPTFVEAGIPEYVLEYWYGIVAPAGTPAEVLTTLHAQTADTLRQPEVKETLARQGLAPIDLTPEEFSAFVRADMARWAEVVKAAGLKLKN
ncbi:tripartite tricarboxylate transporter substrate binding protein [Verticiella sediminum]